MHSSGMNERRFSEIAKILAGFQQFGSLIFNQVAREAAHKRADEHANKRAMDAQ
jgi:hypothetical protein